MGAGCAGTRPWSPKHVYACAVKQYRDLFDLSGRTALVVGAASGIGEASAHALAAFGAHVVCGDIDLAGARRTAEAICAEGGRADALELDVREPAHVSAGREGLG